MIKKKDEELDNTERFLFKVLVCFLIITNTVFLYMLINYDRLKSRVPIKSSQEMQIEIEILSQEVQYLIRDYNKIEDEIKCLKREDKRFPCVVGERNE